MTTTNALQTDPGKVTRDLSTEKLAPHSSDSEEAVLGAMLINPDSILEMIDKLCAEDFYILRNSWVFAAIVAVHERGDAVDYLTVVEELRTRNQLDQIGGAAYITYLLNNTPTHIHIHTYGDHVERSSIRRQMLDAATKIGQVALQEHTELEEMAEAAEAELFKVSEKITNVHLVSGESIIDQAFNQYANWIADPREVRGLRSGIPRLDSFLGGFVPGRPYTIYGATGMGKSMFIAYLTINLLEQATVLLVTTELDPEFWIDRKSVV